MSEIIHIAGFKERQLVKAEAQWLEYMTRAAQFEAKGQKIFTSEMLAKAKEVRKVIDKLRGRKPQPPAEPSTPFLNNITPVAGISMTYEGLASVDLGHQKSPPPTSS